jgi:hypothetical protein
MPKNHHPRNVEGLRLHATAKSEAVALRIDLAIRTLVSQNAPVNFNSVSALAHVSKTTLYSNPNYRARIERLRRTTASVASSASKRTVTDKGKDVILAAKNKRIRELEAEVERLTGILKRCYAHDYDKY